jgi:pimeloyl-ACP methyl ester carboxylesterase
LVGDGTYDGKRPIGETRLLTQEQGELDKALAEAELEDRHTLVIDAETPFPQPPTDTGARRSGGSVADDELLLQVPSANKEVQFALYVDEDGVVSLHAPKATPPSGALPTRASFESTLYTYRIRLRRPTGKGLASGGKRGILGVAAHKIFKILVGKALKGVTKLGEYAAVKLWEDKARSHQGFHSGGLAEFLGETPASFSDWKALDGKRALLFIHGTTSSTRGAFQGLAGFETMGQRLWQSYEGRVLGFNHHTLTKNVAKNTSDFYSLLAGYPGTYEFDIVAHSRGGLLARSLAELFGIRVGEVAGPPPSITPDGVKVKFNRVIFVGTPNDATDLADPGNLPMALDRIATAIHLLPETGATIALGAVFAMMAYLSETGLMALPGLVDQAPKSPFLTRLNAPTSPPTIANRYFAIESDYHPTSGVGAVVLESSLDKFFHRKPNDLIVPTLSVSNLGSLALPSNQVKQYRPNDGVHHTSYFRYESTWQNVLAFLGIS